MRKTSLRETSNLIKNVQGRVRSEGFYLTHRHEKSVGRLIQRLHSATPFCFVHADSVKLSDYYMNLVVKRIEQVGENAVLRFNPLRKDKLTEILNKELGDLPLEQALAQGRADKTRKIIVIENEDELISEDWQDIELICTALPGGNLGLLCNTARLDSTLISSNRLMKDKRVFHAYFNHPSQNELKLLSAVARGRPEYQGVLQTLKDLDLRYSAEGASAEDAAPAGSKPGEGAQLFDELLRHAAQEMAAGEEPEGAAAVVSASASAGRSDRASAPHPRGEPRTAGKTLKIFGLFVVVLAAAAAYLFYSQGGL